jgi:hypothetical protein
MESANMILRDQYHTKHAKLYWASQELEKKAWSQFRVQQEADVLDFILTLSNDPRSRGSAWEAHIHQLIQTCGVRGTLKTLDTDSTTHNFTLRYPKACFFQTFEQIDESAQYWQPVSRRHATCEAYIPNDGLILQMTVSEAYNQYERT